MESSVNVKENNIFIINGANRMRIKEIVQEFLKRYIDLNKGDFTDAEIALILKKFCDKYNCVIVSWIRNGDAFAECYEASVYDEEDDLTWGFIGAQNEIDAIFGAFVWLLDHGYLASGYLQTIKENIT